MPSQATINPAAAVKSYPVVERHRFVWVWMGDPELADPEVVPDLHWNNDPAWAADGKTIHVDCDYRLVVDNLMDLTHESYLHAGSIGNDAVAESPFDTEHGDRQVTVTRWMIDVNPPPFGAGQLGKPGKVDRWQIIHFEAPSTIAIDVGVAPHGTGAPEGDRSAGVNGYVLNTMTPERDGSCWYFWAFARNYKLDEQARTTQLREGVSAIFAQDEDMLGAQHAAIAANPDKVFYNLNIDAGALWARKVIDKMFVEETGRQANDPVLRALR
jgi:vanillate O-demethylase monooxygenase subunit